MTARPALDSLEQHLVAPFIFLLACGQIVSGHFSFVFERFGESSFVRIVAVSTWLTGDVSKYNAHGSGYRSLPHPRVDFVKHAAHYVG